MRRDEEGDDERVTEKVGKPNADRRKGQEREKEAEKERDREEEREKGRKEEREGEDTRLKILN